MKRIGTLILLVIASITIGWTASLPIDERLKWKTEVVQISESKFNKLWKKSNPNCPSVAERGKWTEIILQRKPVSVVYVTYGEKISRLAELTDSTFLIDALQENGTHEYRKLTVGRRSEPEEVPDSVSFSPDPSTLPPSKRGVDIRTGIFKDIEGVGTEWISPYEGCSKCDQYKEVLIDGQWEDGRYIYGVYDTYRSYHGTVEGEQIDILTGRSFVLDYYDLHGLTTCGPDYYMVLSINGKEHLIKLLKEPSMYDSSREETLCDRYITIVENSLFTAFPKSVSKQGDKYIVNVFMDLVDSCENIVYEVDPTTWTGVCRNIEVYLDGGDMWYLY